MGWTVLDETDAAQRWNVLSASTAEYTPFQTYDFGQYFKGLGWKPLYCACFDDQGKPMAMAICLIKMLPLKLGSVWCLGGPSGDLSTWAELPLVVRRAIGAWHVHFRFRCDRMLVLDDAAQLTASGWSRPQTGIGRNLTVVLDPSKSEDDLFKRLDGSWRRNLRRALAKNMSFIINEGNNAQQLFNSFNEMTAHKSLSLEISLEKFERFVSLSGENMLVSIVRDHDGHFLSFRCTLTMGTMAVDYFAASTVRGREVWAAHFLMWELIKTLRARGIAHYDLGGIDPVANPGVHRFKRGTGGSEVEMLGEWECSTSKFLLFGINLAIRLREASRSWRTRMRQWLSTRKSTPD